jgi:hypothetical protein
MNGPSSRLVTTQALMCGSIAAIAMTGLIVSVIANRGYEALLLSDAASFHLVASDPFGDGSILAGASGDTGTAYRYGRILFPLIAWCLAFGQPPLLVGTLPLLYVGAIMLVVTVAATHAQEVGRSPLSGLAVMLVPSAWLTMPILVPEFFVTGLILLLYRLVDLRKRGGLIVAALLLLTRETTVVALAPLGLSALRDRNWRDALGWALAVVPLLVWYSWVRLRVGAWPFADPLVPASRALDVPGRFLAHAWPSEPSVLMFAAMLGLLTLLAGIFVAWRRRTPLAFAGLGMAAWVLVFGPAQTELPGEAVRLMLPAQVIIAAAALGHRRPVAGTG